MKIEKVNDSQIRCTLTSQDLESRKIRLSELAYGSEKARELFQDMMQQAHKNFGFDTENSPLMIEAIPFSGDSIMLVITKVDDPEELDARFSHFSPAEESDSGQPKEKHFSGAKEIVDLYQKIKEAKEAAAKKEAEEPGNDPEPQPVSLIQSFRFRSLEDAVQAAKTLTGLYSGSNTLFRLEDGSCELILHQSGESPESFNRICNILSEYGTGKAIRPAASAFMLEHGDIILRNHALQTLAALENG